MARTTNEDRHRQVLDAATEVIRRKGIEAASISDIAEAAGMHKSTLFHYFSSKAELVERLQERLSEISRDELAAVADDPALSPEARLRALVHIHAHHCVERLSSPVLVAFMQQWGPPSTEHGRQQVLGRQRYEAVFEAAVVACVADGTFRPGDTRVITLGLLGMTTWMAMWYQPGVDPPLTAVVDELLSMALDGLRTRP